jgi:hypothetical protein
MNKTVTLICSGLVLATLFSACGSGEEGKPEIDKEVIDPNSSLNTDFEGKIFSIPSPMQTAMLLQELNAPFKEEYLHDLKKVSNYSTEMQRALNLGIYGTDLGYLSIYKQNSLALKYLSTIEKLTGDLGLEGAFDKTFMTRFEKNSTNKDSMMVIVSDAFKKSDNYLKANDRKNTSALILVGGWIESMYLACNINAEKSNQKILERIGEQTETLNTIIEILKLYNKDKSYDGLIADMTALKVLFDKIDVKYDFVQPKTDAANKTTTLMHKTTVKIDAATLKGINEQIGAIRSKVTE